MPFIDKDDYKDVINASILDDITEVDNNKIDSCEARAISFMKGYLGNRYDVNTIFNQTGSARNAEILGYAKDITLYYLHRLVNWRQVPSARSEAYKQAVDWLDKVNNMQINPVGLPVLSDGQKDYILYGSNPKRSNHI
jgi:phage gp36-like protein